MGKQIKLDFFLLLFMGKKYDYDFNICFECVNGPETPLLSPIFCATPYMQQTQAQSVHVGW